MYINRSYNRENFLFKHFTDYTSCYYSRIYELLPPKIQQWQNSPCISEENNKRSLEKIRRQQLETRQMLGDLDLRHQELDAIVERARHVTATHDQEVCTYDITDQLPSHSCLKNKR